MPLDVCGCKRTDARVAKFRKSCEPQNLCSGINANMFSRSILCSELGRDIKEREGGKGRNLCTETIWTGKLLR